MKKRVFIIHGWGGTPKEAWFPWLEKELEKRNFYVEIPKMPDTENPKINSWTNYIKKVVGKADKNTFFVGHSIGCQAIMRYLEKLPEKTKVGGVVFVAGWFNLMGLEPEEKPIAKPWLETPINFRKIKQHTKKFIAIFSGNDYYVPLSDEKLFKKRLNAKTIIKNNQGHFDESENIRKLKVALDAVLKIAK
ncbi:hypothetical protein COS75_02970 [Candidatus Pacearchaeota archaeon CG06_land_8_20_14_3_00_35_12]|nr:MAG: hypothetical protein COS75_02970 [Candidatus Pacearchaeota archaeon CG06_land_8_20_14_3_00_35_12]